MLRHGRGLPIVPRSAALVVAVLLVLTVAGCGSSSASDSRASSTDAVSPRKFCRTAHAIEDANAQQLDHILTRAEAQDRLQSQLNRLADAASPDQGEGWAREPVPLSKEALTELAALLDSCNLSMGIFGVSAAKSDTPSASTPNPTEVPPTTG